MGGAELRPRKWSSSRAPRLRTLAYQRPIVPIPVGFATSAEVRVRQDRAIDTTAGITAIGGCDAATSKTRPSLSEGRPIKNSRQAKPGSHPRRNTHATVSPATRFTSIRSEHLTRNSRSGWRPNQIYPLPMRSGAHAVLGYEPPSHRPDIAALTDATVPSSSRHRMDTMWAGRPAVL